MPPRAGRDEADAEEEEELTTVMKRLQAAKPPPPVLKVAQASRVHALPYSLTSTLAAVHDHSPP